MSQLFDQLTETWELQKKSLWKFISKTSFSGDQLVHVISFKSKAKSSQAKEDIVHC